MKVLAGDIGGTYTRLMAGDARTGERTVAERFANEDFQDLTAIVKHYLHSRGLRSPLIAVFAVAAPVAPGVRNVRLTNRAWNIDANQLQTALGVSEVRLINDFYAVGLGVASVANSDIHTLQAGAPSASGNRAVIGAGTGLGHALLIAEADGRYRVVASEAGHSDFAPANREQTDLHQFLAGRYGHVSWERVLSGPGLTAVHEFFYRRSPATARVNAPGDPAAITLHGLQSSESLEARALDLFIHAYGAQAGNFALTTLCQGGLYLAGGIARAIVPALSDGRFLCAFRDKGRFAGRLRGIPIHVLLNEDVALRGAINSVSV